MAAANESRGYLADRTALVNTFYAVPIPLEVFSTAYRLWVKAKPSSQGHWAFDDYLMIWATMAAVAECIAGLVYGPPNGLGRHIQAVSAEDRQKYLMGDYIFSHFYDVAIASTKLSILALYYRIFVAHRFRVVIIVTAVLVFMWLLAMEIVLGLGCRPVQGWWDVVAAARALCVDKVAFTYSTNITNMVFDIWIFAMPIPIILGLQASTDKKIGLCFLFSAGLGTCAISAARLSVVVSAGSEDVTWQEVPLGILSAWEPCGGILCANLPLVYRDMVRSFKQIGSTVKSSRSHTHDFGIPPILPYHDWSRITNSGSSHHRAISKVTVTRGSMDPTEMDTAGCTGIKIKRGFKQEFHREQLR
ncbi:uncharacterized protein F4822DRAFT_440638 [Hypoxylon trugodes]|uniref:uncharacterized protein n=1 Tax=Hypoxylon trugodes TaxID=326681 RepID=UPI0021975444|nr:uncharacterized protein F4822DRAFT_440638 [Hypoxylon trugodes]KAI1383643.1 hypothetical protein F4822DRAFT_440638 [Hypoxylon trugodes]